jgi:ABC-type phosphate transport system substrate-binding protein
MTRWAALCLLFAVGGWCAGAAALAAGQPAYVMIVNPANNTGAVESSFVAQAFLKKLRRWPNGETIQPVDLSPSSDVRRQWSLEVLRRSVDSVKSYWRQMIFSGHELPPPEVESDDSVVSYVLKQPGGIGYVSLGANLRGAKVLVIK